MLFQHLNYRLGDERAAQGSHKPHSQRTNHDELPVVSVTKVAKDRSQEYETEDENCKKCRYHDNLASSLHHHVILHNGKKFIEHIISS